MINIKYNTEDDIYFFEVKGHAMYAEYGKDIVCASISTALIMTVNLLSYLGYNDYIYEAKEGYFKLKIKKDNITSAVCLNLDDTLKQLALQYPKNVKYNG